MPGSAIYVNCRVRQGSSRLHTCTEPRLQHPIPKLPTGLFWETMPPRLHVRDVDAS